MGLREVLGLELAKKNPECRAVLFDAAARAQLFISILSLGTALLQYANIEAGCTAVKGSEIAWNETEGRLQTDEEADAVDKDCEGKVFGGLSPSSTLTTMSSIANVIIALTLPTCGAIIDYSSLRKKVVLYSFYGLWVGNFIQIFTSESTWMISVVVQAALCSVCYMFHQASILSYLSEVVDDEEGLKHINASLRVWELGFMLAFTILAFILSKIMGFGVLSQATLAQALACLGSIPFFWIVIKDLGEREAKQECPKEQSLFIAGFTKILKTYRYLSADFPECRKMLIAAMFFESGNANIVNASIVLITNVLEVENPTMILLLIMVVTVPGAAMAPTAQKLLGLKFSMILVLSINILASLLIIFWINSPKSAKYVFVLGLLYGIGIGSSYPIQRTLFLALAPYGQEAEMFGIWQCCCIILQWAPGLIFTYINEMTGSIISAICVIPAFHAMGLLIILSIDLDKGAKEHEATKHLKHKVGGTGGSTAKVGVEGGGGEEGT
ncbi:hypothetical protein TrLO_g7874 [Triparma laevis f. longispina]|uniref:Uncharacterized protein n=1 Tax=Triparma laevis f. longispina TaxID=1714387 RepID=A0A9W7A1Y7_9STRA|nr:hypothetical protein TrLO_g7874 [Triparma laevis f. longispina]